MTAAERWAGMLADWAIPQAILEQAPQSPWIHPVELFAVDPTRTARHTPAEERALEGLALSGGTSVLDVGCGGGKAAFALVPPATRVIGVDHQAGMLERFAAVADEAGIDHEEFLGDWPDIASAVPMADVVACHHVFYNVPDLGPFADALTAHARQRVVAELPWQHPLSNLAPGWARFWGLDRPQGPTAEDAVAVLRERGIDARLERFTAPWDGPELPFDDQVRHTRIRLCLTPDRDAEIASYLRAHPPAAERELAIAWWDVPSSEGER